MKGKKQIKRANWFFVGTIIQSRIPVEGII